MRKIAGQTQGFAMFNSKIPAKKHVAGFIAIGLLPTIGLLPAEGHIESSGAASPNALRVTWPLAEHREPGSTLWVATLDAPRRKRFSTGVKAIFGSSGRKATGTVYHFSHNAFADQELPPESVGEEALVKRILAELFDVRVAVQVGMAHVDQLISDVITQIPKGQYFTNSLIIDRSKLDDNGKKRLDRVIFFFGDDGSPITLGDLRTIKSHYLKVLNIIDSGELKFEFTKPDPNDPNTIADAHPDTKTIRIIEGNGYDKPIGDPAINAGQAITLLHEMMHLSWTKDTDGYWNENYNKPFGVLPKSKWVDWDGPIKVAKGPKTRDAALNVNDAYVFYIVLGESGLFKYTDEYLANKSRLIFTKK
jgi:hypothetical protein